MAIADVLELQLHKYGDTKNTYYLQNYCSEVKLSNSMTQLAAELNFKISYATMSSNLLPIVIEEGDVILLTYTSIGIVNTLFNGVVTDADLKGKDQTLQITAYDYLWWICKCNITKNFDNISVGDALEYIYGFIGATYADVRKELGDNANIMIGSHLVQNKPVHKVVTTIYNYARKLGNTGYFYLYATGNGKEIDAREADKVFSGMTIHPAYTDSNGEVQGNLIDYEIKRSMQNMVTQVDFYKSTGEPFSSIGTGGSIFSGGSAKYGTIIENVEVEDNDSTGQRALAKGNKILSEKGKPTVDITVTCIGDLLYLIGYGVVVQLPNTTYYDICMYIVSSEWTWNLDGSFISKLELSQSQYSDYTDWDDIETEKAQKAEGYSNTATSSLVTNIVNELKKYQGVAYVWGGKDPSGFDCSGYIAYVYNEFSDQLNITSNSGKLTAQTYSMENEGEDITSDFPSNLRVGDIIFPTDEHVVAYIGNNQVIHAPHHGDVVKISDIWFSSVAKVIRVIPDSAWETSSSDGNAPNLNSAAECTSQTEFAGIVASYAKELFKTYHIFPGVIICNMIQESWTGSGFTKLAQSDFNFGGVKAAEGEPSATDYYPPKSEGSQPYRKFDSVADYMEKWCIFMTTSASAKNYGYKTQIADKSTPEEQMQGFANVPYCGDPAGKAKALKDIYNDDNLAQYDSGLY